MMKILEGKKSTFSRSILSMFLLCTVLSTTLQNVFLIAAKKEDITNTFGNFLRYLGDSHEKTNNNKSFKLLKDYLQKNFKSSINFA